MFDSDRDYHDWLHRFDERGTRTERPVLCTDCHREVFEGARSWLGQLYCPDCGDARVRRHILGDVPQKGVA